LLAVAAAGVALAAAFLVVAQQRFLGSDSSGLAETRMKIWASAAEMIRDYPISGVGLDQFLYHHNARYIAPAAWSERYISHPHNLVLDSWLSLGLPGPVLLGLGLVLLTRRMVSISRDWPLEVYWPAAATAAIVTGLVHGLVDNGYFLPDLAVLTWILIALSLGPVSSTLPESAQTR
jgi:O-antigen ligase